jgi:SAM-dependent methyltransferase
MTQWINFWQTKAAGFDKIMRACTFYFAKKLEKKIPFSENDDVLDIGCGPGFLEDFLYKNTKINTLYGLDVSQNYLDICKEKFKENKNYHFLHLDPQNYLDFSMLENQKFSKIIIMSVVQYFQNETEVEKLIYEMQKKSKEGGILIIADIIVDKGKITDILSLAWKSLQNNFFFTFVRFLLYARFSEYYHNRNQLGLLTIPEKKLLNITQKLALKAEIVKNLTINTERRSLVIYF